MSIGRAVAMGVGVSLLLWMAGCGSPWPEGEEAVGAGIGFVGTGNPGTTFLPGPVGVRPTDAGGADGGFVGGLDAGSFDGGLDGGLDGSI